MPNAESANSSGTTSSVPYIETPLGKIAFMVASKRVQPGLAEFGLTQNDLLEIVKDITVPPQSARIASSAEMTAARNEFDDRLKHFEMSIAPPPGSSPGPSSSAARGGVHIEHHGGHGSILIAGGAAAVERRREDGDGGMVEDTALFEQPDGGGKRPRTGGLGMTDSDLSRACSIMDRPPAPPTPEFLKDKPHDVRLYTPLLIELYTSIRSTNAAISRLASELYVFEGDFLDLSPASASALPLTPFAQSMDMTTGSRLFHRLDLLHECAATLKAKNLRTQRAFWLANHTPGCNWDTWDQLVYRELQDAGADICNPGFTPLTTWEDKVKAAIIGARQEAAGLSKDGKSLLGPVLPRLLARHNAGRGGGGVHPRTNPWRGGSGGAGHRGGAGGGGRGGGGSNGHGGGRGRQPRAGGKENRGANAGAAPPPPARQAAQPPAAGQ